MRNLIGVELYKYKKKKYFLIIFAFNCISILYGLGILFNWSWVSFQGNFDLIQYVGAIWQLFFLIGLPLIYFMYIGASTLGGEKAEGQILLEITRVADRNKLVISKAIATLLLVLFYFLTNILISIISYIFLVRHTKYAAEDWIKLDDDSTTLMITCIFGCIYIIFSVLIVMYISIKSGAVISTVIGIALYAGFSLLARIPGIRICIPGYFALYSDIEIGVGSVIQQIIWCLFALYIILCLMKKKISNTSF